MISRNPNRSSTRRCGGDASALLAGVKGPSGGAVAGPTATGSRQRGRGEKGFVLAMTGLLLVPLLAFTAFAVDLGSWYAQAVRLQRAADAAALGGVVWAADADPTKANTVATTILTKNGITSANSTISINKNGSAALTVTVAAKGTLFFGKLFIQNETLTRSATAEYITPVPMGSKDNQLGNDPETDSPVGHPSPQHWLNIAGRDNPKVSGDEFTSRNCTVGTYQCDASGVNLDYTSVSPPGSLGYVFKVHVDPAFVTTGQALHISVYDPAFTDVGDTCKANVVTTAPYKTDPRYAGTALAPEPNSFCTGDNDSGAPKDKPDTTTYIVRAPDGTPLDSFNNPAKCAISFQGRNPAGVGNALSVPANATLDSLLNDLSTANLEQMKFIDHYHQWVDVCKVPGGSVQAGDYIVQVKTNALNPASVAKTVVAGATLDLSTSLDLDGLPDTGGHNRYSFRATGSNGAGFADPTKRSGLAFFAESRLPMYANVSSTPTTASFYLARITPQYKGKTLQLKLWDIADVGVGSAGVEIVSPADATNPPPPNGCTWARDGGIGTTAAIVSTTSCAISNMVTGDFNNHLTTVSMTLPNNYSCNEADPNGCWFKINYSFSALATPSDTTTWSANILGDPVHLTT